MLQTVQLTPDLGIPAAEASPRKGNGAGESGGSEGFAQVFAGKRQEVAAKESAAAAQKGSSGKPPKAEASTAQGEETSAAQGEEPSATGNGSIDGVLDAKGGRESAESRLMADTSLFSGATDPKPEEVAQEPTDSGHELGLLFESSPEGGDTAALSSQADAVQKADAGEESGKELPPSAESMLAAPTPAAGEPHEQPETSSTAAGQSSPAVPPARAGAEQVVASAERSSEAKRVLPPAEPDSRRVGQTVERGTVGHADEAERTAENNVRRNTARNGKEGVGSFRLAMAEGRSSEEMARPLTRAVAEGAAGVSSGSTPSSPTLTPAMATAGLTAPAGSASASLALHTPIQQRGWDNALGERVVWMVREGVQEAKIELNPRHLGPIEVRVALNQDQAAVTFTAQHATTREALETAMPRLREMLGDAGINLAQSEVSQHSPREQGWRGQERAGRDLAQYAGHDEGDAFAESGTEGSVRVNHTLVDFYA